MLYILGRYGAVIVTTMVAGSPLFIRNDGSDPAQRVAPAAPVARMQQDVALNLEKASGRKADY